jgi:3-deoxy-D-manno-octulosonate 8-phosphate phosphatase (KDO 8-P phosphatase)
MVTGYALDLDVSPVLRARADRIQLVLTDCDGVLTDAGVYYTAAGEAAKRFSIRDGMGVELLRNAGIETGIVSGEASPSLMRRAEKLGITRLSLGVRDKARCLDSILLESGLSCEEVAYIGDDVNDLDVLEMLRDHGLTAAPADAVLAVRAAVDHVCTSPGGHGAFREFAEWILSFRGTGQPSVRNSTNRSVSRKE